MKNNFQLGAWKDLEDNRDYKIASYLVKTDIVDSYDATSMMKPIRNQGGEGTCVAFACAAVKESEEIDEDVLSPRFIYDRVGLPGGGAFPRDAMKVLCDEGVCTERCQPYTPNVPVTACADATRQAKRNKIKAYARLYTLDEMKKCLVQNGPFMVSVNVTNKWFETNMNGVIIDGGDFVGGHAVVFVGYSDGLGMVKIRNSWGTGWGQKGYGYIEYGMFMRILMDAWSSVDVPQVEEEIVKPTGFWAWLWGLFFGR